MVACASVVHRGAEVLRQLWITKTINGAGDGRLDFIELPANLWISLGFADPLVLGFSPELERSFARLLRLLSIEINKLLRIGLREVHLFEHRHGFCHNLFIKLKALRRSEVGILLWRALGLLGRLVVQQRRLLLTALLLTLLLRRRS